MRSRPSWAGQWELSLTAARLVGLPESTLRTAIGRGEIETVKLDGGTVLVRLSDVRSLKANPRPVGRKANA